MNINAWRGMILGMAVTDVEGGATSMAEILIESIIENNGDYDPVYSLIGYLDFYETMTTDQEVIGSMTSKVFQKFLKNLSSNKQIRKEQLLIYGESLFDIADQVYKESKCLMADINAVYHALPLAFLRSHLNIDQLATIARAESRLTHTSKISQQSCAALVLLAANLINGNSWIISVKNAAEHVKFTFPVKNALEEGLNPESRSNLSRGSYCTDVIKASVYFISTTNSFSEAVELSKLFAMPSNYCPIIVGALSGIIYGCDDIFEKYLTPELNSHIQRIDSLLMRLYNILIKKPKCY